MAEATRCDVPCGNSELVVRGGGDSGCAGPLGAGFALRGEAAAALALRNSVAGLSAGAATADSPGVLHMASAASTAVLYGWSTHDARPPPTASWLGRELHGICKVALTCALPAAG